MSSNIANRRDYYLEWLRPELNGLPVTITDENAIIHINFQELQICSIEVAEEYYKIFGVSEDLKESTDYLCEKASDGTWLYYVDSADECIAETKRLVTAFIRMGLRVNPVSEGRLIDRIDKILDTVKEKNKNFRYERGPSKANKPEFNDLYYKGRHIGELWAHDNGPDLWTDAISKEESRMADEIPRRRTQVKADVFYRSTSENPNGFHHRISISSCEKIPDILEKGIAVIEDGNGYRFGGN